jgi:hypothetical protein
LTEDLDVTLAYDSLLRVAMQAMIRSALLTVQQLGGMPNNNAIHITLATKSPGVELPSETVAACPDVCTIVMDKQFWDLDVRATYFTVELAFGQKVHTVTVPFNSIILFEDRNVGFQLKLGNIGSVGKLPKAEETKSVPETTDKPSTDAKSNVMQFIHPGGRHLLVKNGNDNSDPEPDNDPEPICA